MSGIKNRPEIDGIRAIAIISVVLFHLNNNILPGGFLGVDIFFGNILKSDPVISFIFK